MIRLNRPIYFYLFKANFSFMLKAGGATLLAIFSQFLAVSNSFAATELSAKETFSGQVNYAVTGGTFRNKADNEGTDDACSLMPASHASPAPLAGIPDNATVRKAYLYWGGSGATVDDTVSFENTSLTADTTYTEDFSMIRWVRDWYGDLVQDGTYETDYFQGVKDVTNLVKNKGNGVYHFKDLTVDNTGDQCTISATLSAWALVVIYDDPNIPANKLNTIQLYEGFKTSREESVNYTLDGIQVTENPNAKFSMLLWEGDSALGGEQEYFSFNDNILSDTLNPETYQFNSTINSRNLTNTYGVDFDTFDVSDYVSEGDTSITGTISTDADLVIQGAAIVMVSDELANQPPEVQPDAIATDEDTVGTYNLITGDPTSGAGQDSDPEGKALELTKITVAGTEYVFNAQNQSHNITMPSGALLTVHQNGDVSYDPNSKFESLEPDQVSDNVDEFTYTVQDPDGGTNSTTAAAKISGVADNPVAQDDNFTTDEDTAKRIHVLQNDSDPNTPKNKLRVVAINGTPVGLNETYTLDSGAVLTVKNVGANYKHKNGDYTLYYDPTTSASLNSLNTNDPDSIETFTYTVSDDDGNKGEGSVTINVEGVTDPFAD